MVEKAVERKGDRLTLGEIVMRVEAYDAAEHGGLFRDRWGRRYLHPFRNAFSEKAAWEQMVKKGK